MPRRRTSVPKYALEKTTGQACVYIRRRRVYLGPYGSVESRRRYAELLAQLAVESQEPLAPIAAPSPNVAPPTVDELCWEFVASKIPTFQKSADGRESKEVSCYQLVIGLLHDMFGATPATEFGPVKLRKVREAMIGRGWSRSFINKQVVRLRAIFRHGVSWELIPQTVADALKSVAGLKPGDSDARETKPRAAIAPDQIAAVKKRLKQRNRDLVELLMLTAARPAELLSLRTCDINRSGEIWRADLERHKNARRGQSRTLWFGPQAQLILLRYLRLPSPEARLFPGRVDTLSKAIKSACLRAKIPPFTAYHLRHTAATNIRDQLGIEHAQALLGHRHVDMTAIYSTKATKHAQEAARKFG